jgi:hypothetical protein
MGGWVKPGYMSTSSPPASAGLPTGVTASVPDAPPPGVNLTLLTDDVPAALARAVGTGPHQIIAGMRSACPDLRQ